MPAQPGPQPRARRRQVGNVAARGDDHLVWPGGGPGHLGHPFPMVGDRHIAARVIAQVAIALRQLRHGQRGNRGKRHDLAVRVVDRGAGRPPPVLEHEDVADVRTRPERGGARRPHLHHPGRPVRAQGLETAVMAGAVQDHLVTLPREGRPAVLDAPHLVRPGRLEAAGAERARAFGQLRPVLAPRGDHDVGTGQRVHAQARFGHEPSRDEKPGVGAAAVGGSLPPALATLVFMVAQCEPAAYPCRSRGNPARAAMTEETAVSARFLGLRAAANPPANPGAQRTGPACGVIPAPSLDRTKASVCSGNTINLNELSGVSTLSASSALGSRSEGKPWAHETSQGSAAAYPGLEDPRPAEAVSPPTAAAGRGEVTGFALVAGPVAQIRRRPEPAG